MALLFFSETKLVKETQTLGNKTPFADKHSSKLLDICDDISSSSSSSSTRWSVISIYRYSGSLLNVSSITVINPKKNTTTSVALNYHTELLMKNYINHTWIIHQSNILLDTINIISKDPLYLGKL